MYGYMYRVRIEQMGLSRCSTQNSEADLGDLPHLPPGEA